MELFTLLGLLLGFMVTVRVRVRGYVEGLNSRTRGRWRDGGIQGARVGRGQNVLQSNGTWSTLAGCADGWTLEMCGYRDSYFHTFTRVRFSFPVRSHSRIHTVHVPFSRILHSNWQYWPPVCLGIPSLKSAHFSGVGFRPRLILGSLGPRESTP